MLYFIGTGDNVGERMQAKEYRADIDVLRAIAVLAVIFYHAHIPFFRGGFVGVSIFFVISGYLITGIIKRKLADGTFSFLEFYENRVRRIFPALFAMVFASCFLNGSLRSIFWKGGKFSVPPSVFC